MDLIDGCDDDAVTFIFISVTTTLNHLVLKL